MIEVHNLRKTFGKREVIKNINMSFSPGVITGIIGPNACGKTTLLKCILGLVIPTSGEIFIDGKKVDKNGEFRRKIGYMPQLPNFPSNLSLTEMLNMFESLRDEKAVLREELISYFELENIVSQPFGELSGGTKQKIAAVIAFMFDAPIVFLDEPTAGLDPLVGGKFRNFVENKAKQGKTIVMVSHFMTELEKLAHDIAFLTEGELLYFGEIYKLYADANISDLDHALQALFKKKNLK